MAGIVKGKGGFILSVKGRAEVGFSGGCTILLVNCGVI